jgi:hypothetical protein
MSHSCVVVSLDDHLRSATPHVRRLWDGYRRLVESAGPVDVVANRTRVTFMVRMRFASVTFQRRCLRTHLVLRRPLESPRVKVEVVGGAYVNVIRICDETDLDEQLRGWICEAYEVGAQRTPASSRYVM